MRRVAVGLSAWVALLLVSRSAGAYTWFQHNNGWRDFDLGGGTFCGIYQLNQDTNRQVACTTNANFVEIPPWSDPHPPAKAIGVDDTGRPFIVGTDNIVYYRSPAAPAWNKLGAPTGVTCLDKIATIGWTSWSAFTNRVLVRECSGSRRLFLYYNGTWTQVQIGAPAADIASGSHSDGTQRLWALANSSPGYPIWVGSASGGSFTVASHYSKATEPWTGMVRVPSRIGGRNLAWEGFNTCQPSVGVGVSAFYHWGNALFYVGDPDPACVALRFPAGGFNGTPNSPPVMKIVSGERGPGNFPFWIQTNVTRVYSARP